MQENHIQLRGIWSVGGFYKACRGFENGNEFMDYFRREITGGPRFEEKEQTVDGRFIFSLMGRNDRKQILRLSLEMTVESAKTEDKWGVPIDSKCYNLALYILPNFEEDPDGPTIRLYSQDRIGLPEVETSKGELHIRSGDLFDTVNSAITELFPDSDIFRTPHILKNKD